MELTEFLLARIAEDEAAARAVLDEHEMWDWDSYMSSAGWYDGSAHRFAQRFDPARVLVECEIKRQIVAELRAGDPANRWGNEAWRQAGSDVLRLLALPYADHPDYDPAWRP